MAAKEVVAFDEVTNQFKAPQSGDTYSLPRSVSVTGNTTVSGDVSASGTVTAGGALSADRMNVGGNVASTTGRVKVNAVEFADGTTALTAQAASGSQNIDSVLGQGNTTLKRITTGGYDMAAVTATLPPITIIASDYFDNSQDSAWIDRCADKSWELEARSGVILSSSNYANATAAVAAGIVTGDGFYNTTTAQFEEVTGATTSVPTTRAGSRKFPMSGFVTAEAGRVIIWYSTSGQPEMWMVFTTGTGILKSSHTRDSVRMSGNILALGVSGAGNVEGLTIVDFTADGAITYTAVASYYITYDNRNGYWGHGLGNRNSAALLNAGSPPLTIVNTQVNSIAITYLDDAPLDEYGMRVPTIAVGTNGGVSVIKHDGSVVNTTHTGGTAFYGAVHFTKDGSLAYQAGSGDSSKYHHIIHNPLITNAFGLYYTPDSGGEFYSATTGWAGDLTYIANASPSNVQATEVIMASVLYGNDTGLAIIHRNPTTPANGMVAYLTNTYNTGWMVGDIRRAYLCNSLTADRSVKGGTLTGAVATASADSVIRYSNFTTVGTESLVTGETDITTGSISFWASAAANGFEAVAKVDPALAYNIVAFQPGTAGIMQVSQSSNGMTWSGVFTTSFPASGMHLVTAIWDGSTTDVYIDGEIQVKTLTVGSIQGTIAAIGTEWNIGGATNAVNRLFNGSLAQVRISATVPTPEQIKHMYETERKLFEPNAKGLLSSSPSVTDLKYNKQHDTYYVKNGTNVDEFKGLQRTDSMALATGVTASGNPLAAPVLSSTGTTNIFKAPAVDMNSSLKALGMQLAEAKQGTVIKTITSSAASVLTMPQGFKPIRVTSATGTYVSLSTNAPTYDGFIWSITTGLAANTAYDVEMRRV